ncbi:chloride channel protein 2-like isoform X2 [Uranotaenia lowii]|uniref:chloride channel protein 2-like isoform X2 n=1 Tax=Uranotaenia lowii TaxID=190385 RepID=UPI0024796AAB|nr:chloride channel protein 2-like isoform X2 [Uranotaenia lowii]XP_055592943.1 chloride channel protein 2-like isoform X2 [Uranotaenia lowii]XP_055592950.1 chloride channel protein 2-like isoform X2 [Uranotaenia lowii]XP_055592955.1 chloride channel protein 2-like isoform X2 [Uranotaenia lowii]XP_055592962.1 chloride channel protein 2-like isoform X2 [Uranotaenia lowii]XP_055592968.1 chloride channel protein 2-like isoform X2 [Uranotaenia lowii]
MWKRNVDAHKERWVGRGGRSDRHRSNSADNAERIIHDEEFGEENVELVDEEWASFERVLREFRERRLLNSSMDQLPQKKKSKRKRAQAFYPMPMPSMSDTVDEDSISTSTSDDDDEAYDTDEDGYITTLMYGRYTKDLGEYAKDEARRLRLLERRRKKDDKERNKELLGVRDNKFFKASSWLWRNTFARLGEDWVFLALLGIIMALLSYVMDKGISMCTNSRVWLYRDLTNHPVAQYLAWVSLPVCLILFSAGFVHLVAPQSIGSGIPEMKTILRGVALKEYLTFKTLVAKVIGLTATLGSGMPLGKEGPFVHIASIVSQLLSKIITSFQSIYENESRNTEMLAAACAVGVGACFAAPVGGVLFSIEVTTTYFAVRNYWRGFFAAVCGATVFRLLAVWFQKADTVTALFATSFTADFPFDPQELFVFALIGLISGLGGASYVWVHRKYVLFMRSNKRMNKFLQKNRFLYPGIVSLIVATLSFPLGFGQFIAGELSTHEQVLQLFSNFTWTKHELTVEQAAVVSNWRTAYTDVFANLTIYLLFTFFFSIVASTIPVPSGIFIPVFKIGAAFGRLVGEAMHLWFPYGVRYGGHLAAIIPGGYSVVGAAAFSGAVTHTVSVGVIVFEMTGQITHIVPVMIASLVSNAVAALLQPSMYDSIILIKKLPYLPDLLPSGSGMYNIYVEDFMVRDVKFIWKGISYQQLKNILKANKGLRSLPIVDSPDNKTLLGSVQRYELIKIIDKHIGREKRLEVAAKWLKEAEEKAREEQERLKREAEELQRTRRPSRFEVSPAPDILKLRERANNEMLPPQAKKESTSAYSPVFGSQPKKSILKKTNSFTLKGFTPLSLHSPVQTPYTTITGTESRIRSAFDIIFKKSATLQDVTPDPEVGSIGTPSITGTDGVPLTPGISKKVQLPRERVIDMSPEDQKAWELEEMNKPIDVEGLHIDPAPFQLVERTSILKVHSLFSMVGINHAYVTNVGQLVGVVALKELRTAIENVNSGALTPETVKQKQEEEARAKAAQKEAEIIGASAEDPLLPKDSYSDKKVNTTITSMDSALSNSDNCSDIELEHTTKYTSTNETNNTTTTSNSNNNNGGHTNNNNSNNNNGGINH